MFSIIDLVELIVMLDPLGDPRVNKVNALFLDE